MSGKIFGITWGLILIVAIALYVGKKWGGSLPLLKLV